MSDPLTDKHEALLGRYLTFYEDLHYGRERITNGQRRRFLDVVFGEEDPETDHEQAYAYHLARIGKPIRRNTSLLPRHMQAGPNDTGWKWQNAADNMAGWRPWHD